MGGNANAVVVVVKPQAPHCCYPASSLANLVGDYTCPYPIILIVKRSWLNDESDVTV